MSELTSKLISELGRTVEIRATETGHCGSFTAMASPCELLIETKEYQLAAELTNIVANEAWRVETTYSRYTNSSQIHQINNANGQPVKVEEELSKLLAFADQCFEISNGLFDITSGVLREIWRFDGSDNIPSRKQAKALLPRIGWDKVDWQPPYITLPPGMQIDLGGFGKEYAVDRAAEQLSALTGLPFLINFGGDLYANKPPKKLDYWRVGIASANTNTKNSHPNNLIPIKRGAIATSGDTNRFLLKDGIRYPHVLNPRTAWPVLKAPSSVTVIADTCIQAGFLATLSMLQGKHARDFLESQAVDFFIN